MSGDIQTFIIGRRRVTVDYEELYDLIFDAPYEFCAWLLDNETWRDLDQVCWGFHIDHVQMLGEWAEQEVAKLPEEIRHPVDGTVRDIPTLLRYLAAALPWKVANYRYNKAQDAHGEHPPTIATEEAVRAAAKVLIDAALGYPPPYRDSMMRRTLAWTDYVDRAWLQGLHIPPPWGRRKGQPS